MTNEEFRQKEEELLKDIPPEFRSAISYHAWEQGHSAGYGEVLIYVSDLADALAPAIRAFVSRIRNETDV